MIVGEKLRLSIGLLCKLEKDGKEYWRCTACGGREETEKDAMLHRCTEGIEP